MSYQNVLKMEKGGATMLKKKKSAEEILEENIAGWGEGKDSFTVSPDEMKIILLSPGAVIKVHNQDNGDGTFFNLVKFKDRMFNCSSCFEIK